MKIVSIILQVVLIIITVWDIVMIIDNLKKIKNAEKGEVIAGNRLTYGITLGLLLGTILGFFVIEEFSGLISVICALLGAIIGYSIKTYYRVS